MDSRRNFVGAVLLAAIYTGHRVVSAKTGDEATRRMRELAAVKAWIRER